MTMVDDEGILEPGTLVRGKYRVERHLASGGMGVVLLATHLLLRKRVALKLMKSGLARNTELAQRFLREARLAARLESEHVVHVYDVEMTDAGIPFLVMDYLQGSDLGTTLKEKGPLLPEDAADYVLQACVALAEAHELGIVHRDLKPSNLFLNTSDDGTERIVVLDFGISKSPIVDLYLTGADSLLGSPHFMSPEQIASPRDVDRRSDIWSLGVTLFQLVSGALPFEGSSAAVVADRVCSISPRELARACPSAPSALQAIVARCLRRDPADRYQDVVELARELGSLTRAGAGGDPRKVELASAAGRHKGPLSDVEPAYSAPEPRPAAQDHWTQSGVRQKAEEQSACAPEDSLLRQHAPPKPGLAGMGSKIGTYGLIALIAGGFFGLVLRQMHRPEDKAVLPSQAQPFVPTQSADDNAPTVNEPNAEPPLDASAGPLKPRPTRKLPREVEGKDPAEIEIK